ncbi:MAG TPA: squalene--hopene cyclase [Candidatus Baltobacteraceae bacterium]|nr:squalene--hopene cyclase [Candidatus Baltobacteraceae bacterium]
MSPRPARAPRPLEPVHVSALEQALQRGVDSVLAHQEPEGFWVHELEPDATITSEYLLLQRWLGTPDPAREAKASRHLLALQLPDGGWPLYANGTANLSTSVKAYFALKMAGLPATHPALVSACRRIREQGGITHVNVFTRILLAMFGELDWKGIPCMPVEIVLLPRWFYFNLYEISYWSRTVLVPLLIIFAHRPVRPAPAHARLDELFLVPRAEADISFPRDPEFFTWRNFFLLVDRCLRIHDRFVRRPFRQQALRVAEQFVLERMGPGGMGGIFPAMANAVVALTCLGYELSSPEVKRGLSAIEDLCLEDEETFRVQPCISVIWDTALTMNMLVEYGLPPDHPSLVRAGNWLLDKQTRRPGDWQRKAPGVAPGGWAFQFENELYPDVDDTAVVLMALRKVRLPDEEAKTRGVARGINWILALQGSDGGWGAYDKDNNRLIFNKIPFADHGALMDPSTEDLAGRVLEALGYLGFRPDEPAAARALDFVKKTQMADGSWYGRWGVNYLYGTWSVLAGVHSIGEDMDQPWVRRAVAWLLTRQNPDGGWGESCFTYEDPRTGGMGKSTASQTAWALLALMRAGEVAHPSVARGIQFLLDHQNAAGTWDEVEFTGTGFPRVFYLRYHGYAVLFPLWALALYRRLSGTNGSKRPAVVPLRPSGPAW